jgi:thiamine-phosphate pyrophosphorylase
MIIVITRPDFFDGEAERIVDMLDSDRADLIHIRKPQSSQSEVEHLLTDIPSELYSRLVLHDHFSLAVKYGLRGVHLNSRNPHAPSGWSGAVSISCHTFRELAKCRRQPYAYMSLSPIFDSISKRGYLSAFTRDVIAVAHAQRLIDDRVMALGGVTFGCVPEVLQMGFGGAMILGDAWR